MLLEQSTTTTLLVKRCLAGDAIAWQQLVDTYARLVHSIPVRHGLSQDEVSDVGQEVFIALAKNLHQLEDPERLPAWLVTTAAVLAGGRCKNDGVNTLAINQTSRMIQQLTIQ